MCHDYFYANFWLFYGELSTRLRLLFSRNILCPTTGKKYTGTISHLCILLISLVSPKLLVFSFFR